MSEVSESPRILVLGQADDRTGSIIDRLKERGDVVVPETLAAGLERLQSEQFSGIFLLGPDIASIGSLLQAGGILEQMPDAVVLLATDLTILWSSGRLCELTGASQSLVGHNFYEAFGTPEIMGPDFCPFHTALGSAKPTRSTLRVGEKRYFDVNVKPVLDAETEDPDFLVAIVRDVSTEVLQRHKLNAIYYAGLELGDLSPQEILEMTVSDRVELLKSKILHYTQDLLEFDTVEIRIVDKRTKRLEPLLVVGMEADAADRPLKADPQDNGVTGFVAATGKSYLCEDTANDPLYLPGAPGARSSLTVPLTLHDEILGTFNVESPRTSAFDENDLQFLELFSREVAIALNTLELLVVEKVTTAHESTTRILKEVANPVDEILNDAAWVLERYIGHEPNVSDRLQRILKYTRDIKRLIQKAGESNRTDVARTPVVKYPVHPTLAGKRILVVDSNEAVRSSAHELLGRIGCDVETAHDGEESLLMVRSFHYDAVIADIRLTDMTGFECFHQVREIHEHLPVILMTGFGYDPTHSIVKARQQGLKSVLYKPFRLDQLITEIEKAVATPSDLANSSK